MINQDEIIEEIRRHREQFAAAFDYDPKRIVDELQRLQKKSGREVVSHAARKPNNSRVAL